MTETQTGGNGGPSDASVPELVRQLSEQMTRLARQEIELAKTEIAEKGKHAGLGAGMFGAAGVVAGFGVGALIAAAILALDLAVTGWLAAVLVGVACLAVAGVLAGTGRAQVQQAVPPVPEQAVETTKEDVSWLKARAKSARR